MIEIRQPELEALIMQRLHAGAFQNVEEVLFQALKDAPLPDTPTAPALTSADIYAALQSSPFKEIDLQPESFLLIAATAIEHNLTLVTRNTKDFIDLPELKLLNPWEPRT